MATFFVVIVAVLFGEVDQIVVFAIFVAILITTGGSSARRGLFFCFFSLRAKFTQWRGKSIQFEFLFVKTTVSARSRRSLSSIGAAESRCDAETLRLRPPAGLLAPNAARARKIARRAKEAAEAAEALIHATFTASQWHWIIRTRSWQRSVRHQRLQQHNPHPTAKPHPSRLRRCVPTKHRH